MGLKTFLNNIRYLFRYNLKTFSKDIEITNSHIDFLKYELKAGWDKIFIPKILNSDETIKYLKENKVSLCRFGDGEFNLLLGDGEAVFQTSNEKLKMRLREVLTSNNPLIKIAIPYFMCNACHGTKMQKELRWKYYNKNNAEIFNYLTPEKTYLDTACTYFADEIFFNSVKELFKNRDITIICGDRVFDKIKNNIFDCANSVEYQYAPTENAFEKYDEILECAKTISKDRLIIIILGPTATVLAYDLAMLGYQALDLGHIAKSYEAFCSNMKMTPKNISNFFGKD